MKIRPEIPADIEAIRALNELAFDSAEEADVIDALRASAEGFASFVASEADVVVGHLSFSPVSLDQDETPGLLALGPMCVLPSRQGEGVGTRLIEHGLEHCVAIGCPAVVLVGHPTYYPRFGFEPASRFGLRCEFGVPDEVFMAREITNGALEGLAGTVRFHAAFGGD